MIKTHSLFTAAWVRKVIFLGLLMAIAWPTLASTQQRQFGRAGAAAQTVGTDLGGEMPADWADTIKWRSIGNASMGGRLTSLAVYEADPSTYWVGSAGAGLVKTVNNGNSFVHQFTHEGSSSIGDVCVAQSDPNIVWVGTGENNPRNSVSYGDGVYKSTDGGETWTHMGLRESFQIGRIQIHPTNPDIVYVGALGRLYGPNEERGLYKTTNGGNSWRKILDIDDETGVIDVQMHPTDPNTLLIATYNRERSQNDNFYDPTRRWSMGNTIYKTTDGGRTFDELTEGLPTRPRGRIGLCYYLKNPDIVYALICTERQGGGQRGARGGGGRGGQRQQQQEEEPQELDPDRGGIFRSADGGETWEIISYENPRPMYYSQIRVDPNDENYIYLCGASFYMSSDRGKSFISNAHRGQLHLDQHDVWIDPNDSRHLIVGCDGGLYQTYDRTLNWEHLNSFVFTQFYDVAVDTKEPYNVLGGLQDNGSWIGPSHSRTRSGITNQDWLNLGGGDGFKCLADPNNPDIVFYESQGGNIRRINLHTGEGGSVRAIAPEGSTRRSNWNTPYILSHHNSKILYVAGNYVCKSVDHGNDMRVISPKITTTDWGSATSLSESPRDREVLYAGTDDGALWGTRDGGKEWTRLDGNMDLPKELMCCQTITASRFADGRVYVAYDAHRVDDDDPYIYVSEDYGETWEKISNNLPRGSSRTVREDLTNPNLLFAGTEFSIFASFNRGESWVKINSNLPTVPVHEIVLHPTAGDIVIATHGRGIWIADVTPLRQMTGVALDAKAHLYEPNRVTMWISDRDWFPPYGSGVKRFLGENAPSGPQIYYSLTEAATSVTLKIVDVSGATIMELGASNTPGLHKATTGGGGRGRRGFEPGDDLNPGPWTELQQQGQQRQRGGQRGQFAQQRGQQRGQRGQRQRGQRGQFGRQRGLTAGQYRVVLNVDGEELIQVLTVRADPKLLK